MSSAERHDSIQYDRLYRPCPVQNGIICCKYMRYVVFIFPVLQISFSICSLGMPACWKASCSSCAAVCHVSGPWILVLSLDNKCVRNFDFSWGSVCATASAPTNRGETIIVFCQNWLNLAAHVHFVVDCKFLSTWTTQSGKGLACPAMIRWR